MPRQTSQPGKSDANDVRSSWLEEHAEERVGVPRRNPGLRVEPAHGRLERRVGNHCDCSGIVKRVRLAVYGGITARDHVVAAVGGELHVRNLKAHERARGDVLGELHGHRVARRGGGTIDARAVEAVEHGDAGARVVKGRAFGETQRDRGDLLVVADRSLPGKARVHGANDARAAILVGTRRGLVGGHGKRAHGEKRQGGDKDERSRKHKGERGHAPRVVALPSRHGVLMHV